MAEQQEAASPHPPQPSKPPAQQQVGQFVALQNIYFNGFALGLSNADINAMLLLDGQPVGRLNMSFTTAKTFVELLGDLMVKLEFVTKQHIMTTRQVEEGLQKLRSSD